MTGLVKRLEAMTPPLVQREPSSADRRSVDVLLTNAGQARFIEVQTDLMGQVRLVFSLLTSANARISSVFVTVCRGG